MFFICIFVDVKNLLRMRRLLSSVLVAMLGLSACAQKLKVTVEEVCTLYVRHPEFFRDREPWSTINMSYEDYNGDELKSSAQSDIRDLKQNMKR